LSEEAVVQGTVDRHVAITFILDSIMSERRWTASGEDFAIRLETRLALEHKSDDQLRSICLRLAGLP
jgi:hypothetical protein